MKQQAARRRPERMVAALVEGDVDAARRELARMLGEEPEVERDDGQEAT